MKPWTSTEHGPPSEPEPPPEALILASASPRRRALLERIGLTVKQLPVDVDETLPARATAEEAARLCANLAAAKTEALLLRYPELRSAWILGADTVISIGGRILGKPGSREEAREYLVALSGATHLVLTGLAVYNPRTGKTLLASAKTEVTFKKLTERDFGWYLDSGEWRDAAGGYKIQERGECLISRISGSYSNVIGLPLPVIYGILSAENFPI